MIDCPKRISLIMSGDQIRRLEFVEEQRDSLEQKLKALERDAKPALELQVVLTQVHATWKR